MKNSAYPGMLHTRSRHGVAPVCIYESKLSLQVKKKRVRDCITCAAAGEQKFVFVYLASQRSNSPP